MIAAHIRREYIYHITERQKELEEQQITVYGIEAYELGYRYSEDERRYFLLEDISSKRPFVSKLLRLVESQRVSPIHLWDVVYDYLIGEDETDST